ncbi:MAG: Sec-independent protein translocase protein TatB [Mesorhizobium sp.]|jgi:sec-independent protein translocase protein TatB
MFDIGWTEMLVIAIVMIVVVGPKDLPRMLRTFGKTTAKLRTMAGDFQKQFNEALKEAELEDIKKSVDDLRGLNPANEIRKQLNPFEKAAHDIRTGLDSALKPSPPVAAPPASAEALSAEPLKSGATGIPGVNGPTAMPPEPVFPAEMAAPAVAVESTAAPAPKASRAAAAGTADGARPSKPKSSVGTGAAKAAPKKTPSEQAKATAPAKPKTATAKNKTKTAGSAS